MSADEQAIRELLATWLQATAAADADTVLSLMTEDAVFLVPGKPPMDKAGFARNAREQAAPGAPRIQGESAIQELRIEGDWAVLINRLTVTVTPSDGTGASRRSGHTLTVFERHDGRWLLARDANLLTPDDI